MFVDASAVVAILNEEDLAEDLMSTAARFTSRLWFASEPRSRSRGPRPTAKRSRTEILNLAISAVDDFIAALDAEAARAMAQSRGREGGVPQGQHTQRGAGLFNIKGNDFRRVAGLRYRAGVLAIRFFCAHREYDAIDAEIV